MTGLETYLFLKLDAIGNVLGLFGVLIAIVVLIVVAVIANDSTIAFKTKMRLGIVGVLTGVFFCVAGVMVPTTKEAMIIYAVPTISEYVKNSKELKELPDNVVKTANEWVTNFRPDSISTSAKEFIEIIKK